MSGDDLAMFGMVTEMEAIVERAEVGELTEDDQAKLAAMAEALSTALPGIAAACDDLIGIPIFSEIFNNFDFAALINEWLAEPNGKSTYRTEPIPGAELGGQPRNSEADVIDEIDRLVDWQMEQGEK